MRRTSLAIALAIGVASLVTSSPAVAQEGTLEVRITNLTYGQILSPVVVAAHDMSTRMFLPGRRASSGLAALAEDADAAGLLADLSADSSVSATVVGDAPILPGTTASVLIDAADANRLSLVSMLVTTNDAFLGVESFDLTSVRGRSDFFAYAFDAGSEANTEQCAHIPGPPCGNAFVRVTKGAEGSITVHRGVHGAGDLVPETHDWRNPVARIVIIER